MGTAALAARVILAAIFITAGVAKLLDVPGSRRALVGFGLSEGAARIGGTVLPLVELSAAAALLFRPSAVVGAAGAVILLGAFVAGIAVALARGEAPDCHCFGQIHSAPANPRQIIRNLGLAALAVFILGAGPGPAIDSWLRSHGSSELVAGLLGFAALTLLALSLHLWAERRRLGAELAEARKLTDAQPPGLPVGARAPDFAVPGQDGRMITLGDLRAKGRPIVLVFGVPGCGPCSALRPELPRWQESLSGEVTFGLVGLATFGRFEDAAAKTGMSMPDLYKNDPELAQEFDDLNDVLRSYRLESTPAAVVLNPEGTIASATVVGKLAIESLIHLTLARRRSRGPMAGQAILA